MADQVKEKSLGSSVSITTGGSQEKLPETSTKPVPEATEPKPDPSALSKVEAQPVTPPPYSGFSPGRRRFILAVTTIAGFLGPLAGGIYLPALPVLKDDFKVSGTAINASVSVFMAMFAVGVSLQRANSRTFVGFEELMN